MGSEHRHPGICCGVVIHEAELSEGLIDQSLSNKREGDEIQFNEQYDQRRQHQHTEGESSANESGINKDQERRHRSIEVETNLKKEAEGIKS